VALLFSLEGCAVGPDFKPPPATVPKDWRSSADPRVERQAATDSRWWKSFGDPVLDGLVEGAYRENLPLQVTGLRIVEARAQLALATGMLYPQQQGFFANGSAIGLSQNISKIGNLPRNYLGYQAGFDAAWELDFWGKYRRGVEAQTANLVTTLVDYYAAIVALTAEVARTYVVIRTFEALIDYAKQNVVVQEEGLKIADSRFHNGATSELDPTQATTLLQTTRASIPPLEMSLQQSRNALSTLLGQPPGVVDARLAAPSGIPKVPGKVAVAVPADVLRRRPDIRSAELVAAAQCARIGVAKAELYPSFSLEGTIALDASTRGTASANLFSTSSIYYIAGPRINWAFLNYGRLKNAVRIEDARFQQSLVNYKNTVLKAAQEVEDALIGYLKSQEAMQLEQAATTSAQHAVELALVSYREGAADYQRVLEAQRALLERQNSLAQQNSAIATNIIALYKALGGGWELRQGDQVVPESTQQEMKKRTDWGDMIKEPRR
jgi:NodT family efflux transporter outer membrane factor (OMF) lipoprotein